MSWDPYLDLDHGVLHNRLGITDPDTLAATEAAMVTLRVAELERRPIPGRFDLPHLQHLHFWMFQDIYSFAGQLRRVRLGKGGQPFCAPELLTVRATEIADRRTDPTWLSALDREALVHALAGLLADLNDLHSFREGNGRSTRALLRQLVSESGGSLSWIGVDRERNIAAARAAQRGDRTVLEQLLDDQLVR